LTITEVELAAYRTAHAPPASRRGAAVMPPRPAGSDGSPAPHTPPRT
jgi:hypothetical protein